MSLLENRMQPLTFSHSVSHLINLTNFSKKLKSILPLVLQLKEGITSSLDSLIVERLPFSTNSIGTIDV